MMPATPVPKSSGLRTPVEVKLKPKWSYDTAHRIFVSGSGEKFDPAQTLPKKTKIVYKTPSLLNVGDEKLSPSEKNLLRHMQVILPFGESPFDHLDDIRSWPCVQEAHAAPEISLPIQ
jgi:hypothetical protein